MGGGGIINQRAAVLLVAVTDPTMYESLTPEAKATVDAIDAKDPLSRDYDDVVTLLGILEKACGCCP